MTNWQKGLPGCVTVAVLLFSFNPSPPPKAECTARNQGVFWPPDANHNPRFLQTQAAAGDLWLCRGDYDWDAYFVQTIHFFKWQRLTVRVTEKNRDAKRALSSAGAEKSVRDLRN